MRCHTGDDGYPETVAGAEAVDDPQEALERARKLAGEDGAVLVTGSLYLLADLSVRSNRIPWESSARG